MSTPESTGIVFEIWHGEVRLGSVTADVFRLILALFVEHQPVPLTRPREAPAADVETLRATLKDLEALPLAALLRELGVVLYNRDIRQWRTLTDVSDELIDTATGQARNRLTEQMIHKGPVSATGRATLRKQRRSRKLAS